LRFIILGVRSQEPELRSQEPELRSQNTEYRIQESGVRTQESGARTQESGARTQESGVRSQEPEFRSQEPEFRSQEPEFRSQESELRSQNEKTTCKGFSGSYRMAKGTSISFVNISFHRRLSTKRTLRIGEAEFWLLTPVFPISTQPCLVSVHAGSVLRLMPNL